MKGLLARVALLTTGIFLITGVASPGSGVPAAVHYIGHAKVVEVMSKGGPIIGDPGLVVLAQRRTTGPAEYHDRTNHVFIMRRARRRS
jgi:hypothetical protein